MKKTEEIRKHWENNGYVCINLISTSLNGVPDFLMMKKNEVDVFVESKEKNDKLSELQKLRINELLELGKCVFINELEIKKTYAFKKFNF